MDTPPGEEIESAFHAALEAPPHRRKSLISQALRGDQAMVDRVLDLVRIHEAGEAPRALIDLCSDEIALAPGDRIGKWTIVRYISRGSFGKVYEAVRDGTEQRAALKLLHRGDADQFRREARTLGLLRHRNIARVLDLDVVDEGPATGHLYHVTELIEGHPLGDWLRSGRRSAAQIASVMGGVADGLAYAHARGVVHRDIKPSNVIVTPDATPVIIDFGVSRLLEESGDGSEGRLIGAPAYMPPESMRGDPVNGLASVDAYALGVMLYQSLEERLPFEPRSGESIGGFLTRKAESAIPDTRGGTRELRALARAGLEPDFEKRLSVELMAEGLRRVAHGRPTRHPPCPAWRRLWLFTLRQPALAMVAVTSVVTLGLAAAALARSEANAVAAQEHAERQAYQLHEFARWVIWDLNDDLAELPGTTRARRDLLERATATMQRLAQPPVDDELAVELAEAYVKLTDISGSRRLRSGYAVSRVHNLSGEVIALLQPRLDGLSAKGIRLLAEALMNHATSGPSAPGSHRDALYEAIRLTEHSMHTEPRALRIRVLSRCYLSRKYLASPVDVQPADMHVELAREEGRAGHKRFPTSPAAAEACAWAEYWWAYRAGERDDPTAIQSAARSAYLFEKLSGQSLDYRNSWCKAAGLHASMVARWGDPREALVMAASVFAELDREMSQDPDNANPLRSAEVLRARIAGELISRIEQDPQLKEFASDVSQMVDEAIFLYDSRSGRGWISVQEQGYGAQYSELRDRVETLRRQIDE